MHIPVEEYVRRIQTLPYSERRGEIHKWVRPRHPRFLYKFRAIYPKTHPNNQVSIKHIQDIVVESKLWLSSPIDFNDPFDMSAKIIVEGTKSQKIERINTGLKEKEFRGKERKQRAKELLKRPNKEWAQIMQEAHSKEIQNTGICSFGGDPNSILMWSHYADHHKGICLQLEVVQDFETFSNALPMDYEKTYPIINWLILKEFQAGLEKASLCKHKGWEYEKEHRIIKINHTRRYLNFRPEALTRIIFGCRVEAEHIKTIEELLKDRASAGRPPIEILHAEKHPSKYRLRITKNQNLG